MLPYAKSTDVIPAEAGIGWNVPWRVHAIRNGWAGFWVFSRNDQIHGIFSWDK
ncbi:hypothetical protein SAMN05216387_11087 [Nitrosovibrio tenuis]|uniref:Uncharacterized protein n=1 Tax=Nitrosovibrio tenuis TaxID=1233 RepID=A0A1H7Q236_9PROT|nr:hypothetical protein SAMN05216387_11087 [Nitrosovibrio tenuis]